MIRNVSLLLIISLVLGGCLERKTPEKEPDIPPALDDSLAADHETLTDAPLHDPAMKAFDVSRCTYDTSMFTSTTGKLKEYQADISYRWDRNHSVAQAVLADGDTLWLSLGGCLHFHYRATLSTALPMTDSTALMDKTRWIARTFFDLGFDREYDDFIKKGQFKRSLWSKPGLLHLFDMNVSDTVVTDHVYMGFSFEKRGVRTRIKIEGYN